MSSPHFSYTPPLSSPSSCASPALSLHDDVARRVYQYILPVLTAPHPADWFSPQDDSCLMSVHDRNARTPVGAFFLPTLPPPVDDFCFSPFLLNVL